MRARLRLGARAIDFWEGVRDRPFGRTLRRVRQLADPLVYGAWYAFMWTTTLRPRGFNAKVRYKMVRDRRPLLTTITDKVAVRDYVARRIGEDCLPVLHQVHASADDVRWRDLPREFACKVTHASGGALIVTDAADPKRELPERLPPGHARFMVHPDAFDPERATAIVRTWLGRPYGWAGWKREWAYRDIRPRVLVEEYLRDADGNVPPDYKLFVFDGVCRMVQVDSNRYGDRRRDLFTPSWERLDASHVYPRSRVAPAPPPRLDEMVRLAERLAEGLDFIRADFYALGERIVFGELTSYPGSGTRYFKPAQYERLVGDWWKVPVRYV